MKKSELYDKTYQVATNPYLIAAIILCLLLIASFGTHSFMGSDEGIWHYIGWLWAKKGIPPYMGGVENKTPGIFILFAISNLLFGTNFWFPRILGILAMVATSTFLYLIGSKLHNHLAGILAMILFGFTMAWRSMGGSFAAQTESFMLLFSVLAFFTLIKAQATKQSALYTRGLFLSGFFMGFAIAFKQIAIFSALALFLFYLNSSDNFKNVPRDFLLALAGIISATFISVIPLLISNVSLADYWQGAWLILLQPGSTPPGTSVRIDGFIRSFITAKMAFFYPLLFLFFAQRKELIKKNIPFWGITCWVGLDFIGANASGYYWTHQLKQLIPALALACGIALSMLFEMKPFEKSKQKIVITIVILTMLWLPHMTFSALRWAITAPCTDTRKELGLWLKKNTTDVDYIYVCGKTGEPIQVYSDRKSSSRYFNTIFLDLPGARKELTNDLKNKPPKFILVNSEDTVPAEINKMINQSYQNMFTKHGYIVYKRDYS